MSQYNDRETLSTLRFGLRAKSIKNSLKQNAQRSAKELLSLLTVAEAKIKKSEDLIVLIQTKIKMAIKQGETSFEDIIKDLDSIYSTQD